MDDDCVDNFSILESHLRYIRPDGSRTFKNKAFLRQYWETRQLTDVFDWMMSSTAFLPVNTSVSVRVYFIEHNLTTIPLCPVCTHPINIPKTYGECLPTTHNTCIRAFVDSKIKATNLARYGGNPMHNDIIKQRYVEATKHRNHIAITAKTTTTKRKANPSYGLVTKQKLERKTAVALLADIGYTHSSQHHIPISVLNSINNPDWLEYQYTDKTAKQIAREIGVNKTVIQNRLHAFNIPTIKRYSSDLENQVAEFVESIGLTVTRNTRVNGLDFEIDIFVPSLNIGIEFHGLYWHTEQNQPRKNIHNYKHKCCSKTCKYNN